MKALLFFAAVLIALHIGESFNRPEFPSPRPQLLLAAALQKAGRYDEAIKATRDVISNPRSSETKACGSAEGRQCSYRSQALSNLATLYMTKGDLDRAIGILEPLERDEPFPGGVHNLVAAYLRADRLNAGWHLCRRWESAFDSDGILWMNCGQILVKMGMCGEAKAIFKRAATIDPDIREFFSTRRFACTPRGAA